MKKFLTVLALLAMTPVFAINPSKGGKVILIVSIEVKNAVEWKKAFDAGAPAREKAGIKVLSISSALENENQITVVEEAASEQSAKDFLNILKSRQKAGDMNSVDVKIMDRID